MSDRAADSIDDHHGWQAGFQQLEGSHHPVSNFIFHSTSFSHAAIIMFDSHDKMRVDVMLNVWPSVWSSSWPCLKP